MRLAIAIVALAACHFPTPSAGFACDVTADCDNGRVCESGFCVVGETAQVIYKCTDVYDASSEIGIAWNDPSLAIDWPIREPLLSQRDAANPILADVMDRLPEYSLL